MSSPYLSFGLPRDAAAYAALGGALAWVLVGRSALGPRLAGLRTRTLLLMVAVGAALLSAGYVAHYLRGGPRIIDATSYYLEARALAGGQLAFDVPAPGGSFRGRFLVTPPAAGERLAVIFPPGYPALLALGFVLGAPLWVGPLLAALLVLATYWLTRELLGREDVARLAAVLSALCAALRYHTADTMSHGLSALLFALSLACAWRGGRALLGGGLALGWLIATRPVTGVVALVVCGAVAMRHRWRALLIVPALVPGVVLLLAHQQAATGDWLASTQLRYYGLADGPPGCFGWGFGAGVGCVFEHGDYVRARLSGGYGAWEAASNTVRRLALHGIDVANFVPLALLVPFAIVRYRRSPGVLALGAGALGTIFAYAGFYFDGSYPGAGARFYADALPLEHGLLALALAELRLSRWAPALALLGFALHAVHGHRSLATREGGRPMFERRVVERAGVSRGLVFVGTDHGFNLGHDPNARGPWHDLLVARARGDTRDALLWEGQGRPPAFRYLYDPGAADGAPRLEPFVPELPAALRFEAEAEWPLLDVTGGYGHPDFRPEPCVSAGRGLRLERTAPDVVSATVAITPRSPGLHEVTVQWLADRTSPLVVEVEHPDGEKWSREELVPASAGACLLQATKPIEVLGSVRLRVTSGTESVLIDYIELHPSSSKLR